MFNADFQDCVSLIWSCCFLCQVDVRKCEAWNPEDRRRIFEVVQSLGCDTINSMVFELLRDWVVATTRQHMTTASNEEERLRLMNALGRLYEDQGKYDEALPLYEECLQVSKEVLGDRHPNTLGSINNLAMLYKSQGEYSKALPLYEECLQVSKEVLGDRHPDTLYCKRGLVNCKSKLT